MNVPTVRASPCLFFYYIHSHRVPGGMTLQTLSENFNARYEIVRATTEGLIRESQRFRYKIYCSEKSFFDKESFSEGFESDEFDHRSVHSFIRNKKTRHPLASVRLVLSDPSNEDAMFPVEKHCGGFLMKEYVTPSPISRKRLGEISRFAVSREELHCLENEKLFTGSIMTKNSIAKERRVIKSRRSVADRRVSIETGEGAKNETEGGPGTLDNRGDIRRVAPGRRFFNYLTLGLARAVMEMAADNNVSHLYACMEPALSRLLSKYSIFFEPLGPLVNYFGLRQPCFSGIDELLGRVLDERHDIWEFITDGGRLCSLPSSCLSNRG